MGAEAEAEWRKAFRANELEKGSHFVRAFGWAEAVGDANWGLIFCCWKESTEILKMFDWLR